MPSAAKPRSATWSDEEAQPRAFGLHALPKRRLGRRSRRLVPSGHGVPSQRDLRRLFDEAARLADFERPQMEAPTGTVTLPGNDAMTPQRVAEVAHITEQRRARALPYQLTAATAAAGTSAWGAAEAAGVVAGVSGHGFVSASAGIVTAGVWCAARAKRHRLFSGGGELASWRARYWVAAGASSGWVTAASVDGPGWWLAAALAGGACALAGRWQRAHEVPVPELEQPDRHDGAAATVMPVVDDLNTVEGFAARWSEKVARRGGQVPDSTLLDGRRVDGYLEYRLTLAGDMTVKAVLGKAEQIASALSCDRRQLVIEDAPPGEAGWGDASTARLRFVLDSPITDTVGHGPRLTLFRSERGTVRVPIGPYVDGEGDAELVVQTPNSAWSAFIAGATGSGKTALVNSVIVGIRAAGHNVTVYFDGKLNSSPELADAATVSRVGLEHAEPFTAAVERLVVGLGLRAAAEGRSGHNPDAEHPTYTVCIDECDLLFKLDGMARRWGNVAKTLRALGGRVVGISQTGNVTVFGGEELLRSSLAAGNVVLMRIPTGSTGTMVAPDLPSPKSITQGGGYGVIQALDSRQVEFRARHLRSVEDCVRDGDDPDVAWNARTALATHPDAEMCPVGRAAFAELLEHGADPEQRRASDQQAASRRLAEFLAGAPAAHTAAPAPAATSATGGEVAKSGSSLLEQVPAALGAGAVRAAAPSQQQDTSLVPDPGPVVPGGLTANQTAAWRHLDPSRPATTAEIAAGAGLRPDSTSKVLASLARKGLAHRHDRGRWTATTPDGTGSPTGSPAAAAASSTGTTAGPSRASARASR